jgi:hypothetical protein
MREYDRQFRELQDAITALQSQLQQKQEKAK